MFNPQFQQHKVNNQNCRSSGLVSKCFLTICLLISFGGLSAQSDMIITGVIDGPLTGGTPKAVEFFVVNSIADLSIYGFGSANNGGGTDGEEFTFPAVPTTAGTYIYVATEATQFTNWFGFAPTYTHGTVPNINGNDAIELFKSGVVVDVFGEIAVDGTGQPWEYMDGWAYRIDRTGPDGSTFVLANWFFSGVNALDGESDNAAATSPFPTATYRPPLPHDFLFLAEEFVESKKHKLIEGDIHSNNDIEIKKGKKSDIVGNLTAADDIEIGKKNDVEGDATAGGDVENDGDVSGTIAEDAGVAEVPLPVIAPFAVGTDDIEVEKKSSLDLSPDAYRNVEVEKQATLRLSAGTYFLRTLELGKKAELCIDVSGGPVVINVLEDLVFGKSSGVVIKPSGEADSDQVTFNFADDDDDNGDDDFVKIGKKATVLGTLIAPDAWVVLESKSRFKGAICAENIVVKSKVVALHHSSTSGLPKMLAEDEEDEEELRTQSIPMEFELGQNYPNPFNPSTTISFALPQAGKVSLKIYNLRGQLVSTLHDGALAAGRHQMVWNGKDRRGLPAASGVYVYRLETDEFVATKKLTLMK